MPLPQLYMNIHKGKTSSWSLSPMTKTSFKSYPMQISSLIIGKCLVRKIASLKLSRKNCRINPYFNNICFWKASKNFLFCLLYLFLPFNKNLFTCFCKHSLNICTGIVRWIPLRRFTVDKAMWTFASVLFIKGQLKQRISKCL